MNTAKAAGNRGEAEVARLLRKRGCTLLASQWRCRFGEIDLVAQDRQGMLHFVEVKLRSNLSVGLPREFVDARKQEKLRLAAAAYLSRYELDLSVCLFRRGGSLRRRKRSNPESGIYRKRILRRKTSQERIPS